ncbi:MAG: YfhO family protein [Bacilli bacterium]|nr:YfhO family protein [Bacilli bacterium]
MDISFAKDKRRDNPFKVTANKVIDKIKKWSIPNSFYYFLILISIGICFYLIMLAENNFSLAYGGDYSAQYIPMGYHVWDYFHDWFKTGHFDLFDSSIYLGVNSFGSNAYYGLFSPFNIILIIFPRSFVPQSLAITSIIKLACAGLFFSMYMKRAFGVKDVVARTCGVAYGFAGWGAFYLWYNNYQDILVFFPLVLLGVERVLKENKPWTLCTGVFFLFICNYVLAVSYIICGFFYAMFRFFQMIRSKTASENFKTLGFGFVGFMGGILMSALVFGPAMMATLSSPKLGNGTTVSYLDSLKDYLKAGKLDKVFEQLFSWNVAKDQHGSIIPKRVFYPIIEFFFPATTCRSLPTLELQNWDFDDMAVSLWCYIPFILFLVPSLIQSGKEKKWSHYIAFGLLVLSLFTPFMYYLTMGFTNGYARWTLFIATSLIAYVGIYLDKIPNVAKWHIHIGFAFAVIGIVTSWILTYKLSDPVVDGGQYGKFMHRMIYYANNGKQFDLTNLAFIIELVYTSGVYLTLFFVYNKKAFHILTTIFISVEAIVMGNLVTWGHGYDTRYNNGYAANDRFRTLLRTVTKGDKSFYRIYSSMNDDVSVNNNMMNGYSSGDYFHSLYNFEVGDFTMWNGLRDSFKGVGGHYRGKYQDLDNLLGIKYYFVSKNKAKYNNIESVNPGGYTPNVPFDFTESTKYEKDKSEYLVYENNKLNEFGHSYSKLYDPDLNINRYSDDTIKNGMLLSTYAKVTNKEAQAEIVNSNDVSLMEDYDFMTSLQTVTASQYTRKTYDITGTTGILAKQYPVNKIADIPDEFPEVTYRERDENGYSKAQHYFAFYESRVAGQPLFTANTSLYIMAQFTNAIKFDFYFLEKDESSDPSNPKYKIFMYDMHDDDSTDNTAHVRGFYLRKNVYKMAVCGKYDRSFFSNISEMHTEFKEYYDARRDALNEYPIKNVKYSSDKFTFTTDYPMDRFVVSYVPYDAGWKLTAKDTATGKKESIKLYNGNGGFVSFVAPKSTDGKNIEYTLTYITPYLAISYIVSALSVTSFFLSMVGYTIYQNNKKRRYLDHIYRENY